MSCDSPLIGIITKQKDPLDLLSKREIKLKRPRMDESLDDLKRRYGSDRVLLLPCGHCPSCLLAKRREWMIRCSCEALYHQNNCFVTLTYDDQHRDGKLHKEHFQNFVLNLRNQGFKVRYFACGEYGERSNREHMHAILFGFLPDDLVYSHDSDSGEKIFTSEIVSKAWEHGLAVVQYFSSKAAGYVAGYTNKKVLDDRGFIMTSRRPGLGYQYFIDNYDAIYKYDKIQESFSDTQKFANVSRYFDKLAEKDNLVDLDLIKSERLARSEINRCINFFIHHFDHDEQLFSDMRIGSLHKLNQLKRGF